MQLSLLILLVSTVSVFAADAHSDGAGAPRNVVKQHVEANKPPQFLLGPETQFTDLKATLVVPPLNKIRHPQSIQRDVLEIQDAVNKNETNYTWYNVRIQELLFERFMVFDHVFPQYMLEKLDSIIEETFALLYNKIFNNPEIDPERKVGYQRAMRDMMAKRMPYIEILYMNELSGDSPDFNSIMSSVIGSRIISITNDPKAPEDRMATLLVDASEVLMSRVLDLRV